MMMMMMNMIIMIIIDFDRTERAVSAESAHRRATCGALRRPNQIRPLEAPRKEKYGCGIWCGIWCGRCLLDAWLCSVLCALVLVARRRSGYL